MSRWVKERTGPREGTDLGQLKENAAISDMAGGAHDCDLEYSPQ